MRAIFFAAALSLVGCFSFEADLARCRELGVCAPPTPVIKAGTLCSGDNWCWATALPHNNLWSVVSIDATHAWAFGDEGMVLRFDGTRWVSVGGLSGPLRAAIAFGPNDLYVTGPSLMHWDGAQWTTLGGTQATSIAGVSPDDLWLAPEPGTGDSLLIHRVGGQFVTETLAGPSKVFALHASAPNSVWAVGEAGVVRHWNGTAWLEEASGLTTAELNAVWSVGDEVWVAGDNGVVLHKKGGAWAMLPRQSCPHFYAIGGSGADDVWFAGVTSAASHWTNGMMQSGVIGDSKITFSIAGGPAGLFAVGRAGALFQRVGTAWKSVYDGTLSTLTSVHGIAANDVWAVGDNGTTAHFDGQTWNYGSAGTSPLRGVFVSSANVAWAVNQDGDLLRRSDGAWKKAANGGDLRAVWASSETDAWAVGLGPSSEAIAVHKTAGGSVPFVLPGTPALNAVWGVSDTDVWAVGEGGTIVHWNGTVWLAVPSGATDVFTSVNVKGTDDVWVGGPNLVLHRVAGSWKRLSAPEGKIINALADDLNGGEWFAARDGLVGRADAQGTSGQATGTNLTLNGIWGAAGGVAFAVGDDGAIFQHVPAR